MLKRRFNQSFAAGARLRRTVGAASITGVMIYFLLYHWLPMMAEAPG